MTEPTTSPSAAEARAWAERHGLLDMIRRAASEAPPLPAAARSILTATAAELRRASGPGDGDGTP